MNPETGEIQKVKQPHFIRLPGGGPFAFAGLMARWIPEGRQPMVSCSIITKETKGPAAEVHSRMPLVLPRDAESAWLDATQADGKIVLTEALAQAVTALEHCAVRARVNSAKNQSEDLIAPLETPA